MATNVCIIFLYLIIINKIFYQFIYMFNFHIFFLFNYLVSICNILYGFTFTYIIINTPLNILVKKFY